MMKLFRNQCTMEEITTSNCFHVIQSMYYKGKYIYFFSREVTLCKGIMGYLIM